MIKIPASATDTAWSIPARASIETKPAATLLGGAVITVALGLVTRHTGYDPSVEEVTAWTTLANFAFAWSVPTWWPNR